MKKWKIPWPGQWTKKRKLFHHSLLYSGKDFIVSAALFFLTVLLCLLLRSVDPHSDTSYVAVLFFLDVFLTALLTDGYLFSILIAVTGVLCVDYVFTEPYWEISFTLAGFPLTFIVMMFISVVTGMLTSRAKQVESLKREAERERIHSNLLRAVSHDIRTPLTGIVGATDVLLDQENALTPEQRHQLLSSANEDARWLIRIVENLLSITRMGEDTRITKQPEAAEEVLGEVARKFRKHYPDVKISVAVPDELLIVPMDAILIEQVMTNLLENAVRHGKNTTHIALSVHQDGENAVFAVQDNGGGIPPKLLPVLFSGTLRHSDTPTGDGKRNMGLGLSVCNAIVRAHGGTMHAQNRDGGAEFIFCLPMIEKEPELQ